MPIGGAVITVRPERMKQVLDSLGCAAGVEVHGADDRGNVVAVFDTGTTAEMEVLVKDISKIEDVLNVGLTFLNAEDEVEKIDSGALVPKVFGKRKQEKEGG